MRLGIGCNRHTLQSLAEKEGVSTERIRQLELRAIRKIQRLHNKIELEKSIKQLRMKDKNI